MTKEITIVEFKRTDALTIYCTKRAGDELCGIDKFIETHKSGRPKILRDLQEIMTFLLRMSSESGSPERYFRREGRSSDRLCAMPVITGNSLRLFCLRISDGILIVGEGGVKRTKKYQDTPELNESAEILQTIDKQLMKLEKKGEIFVLEREIEGIEDIVFKID